MRRGLIAIQMFPHANAVSTAMFSIAIPVVLFIVQSLEPSAVHGQPIGFDFDAELFPTDTGWGGPVTGADKCGKDPLCDACASGKNDVCEKMDKACKKSLCNPICLGDTAWDLEYKVSGVFGAGTPLALLGPQFKDQVEKSLEVKKALDGQFKGQACSTVMQCCDPKSPHLFSWVESQQYGGTFPIPAIPIPVCEHDPADEEKAKLYCDACKAASVEVKIKESENCKNFPNPPDEDKQEPCPGEADDAFKNANMVPKDQVPAHKGYHIRCMQIQESAAKANKGKLEKYFGEKMCSCLGCCDEERTCFFPVTFSLDPLAGRTDFYDSFLEEKNSDGRIMHSSSGSSGEIKAKRKRRAAGGGGGGGAARSNSLLRLGR